MEIKAIGHYEGTQVIHECATLLILHFTYTRLRLWSYSTISKLLPKLLFVVAILVSLPSLSFDCHSDGSFVGSFVASAASIDNFKERGVH